MRKFIILSFLVIITACTSTIGDTPQQRYFGAKADYDRTLGAMISYKRLCDVRPLTDPCYNDVRMLQVIDLKLFRSFELADIAMANSNMTSLEVTMNLISVGLAEAITILRNRALIGGTQ